MTTPTLNKWGRLLADFETGTTYNHPWEVTLDGGAIALMQASFLDAAPLYSSAVFARELGFRDRPLSPLLCLNLGLSFSVHDVSEQAIAHLAYVDVRFPEPGYPGDTVRARSTVLDVKPTSSNDRGVVHVRTVLVNEHDHVLCAFERKALIRAGMLYDRPKPTPVKVQPTPELATLEHLPANLKLASAYMPRSTLPGLAEDFVEGNVYLHDAGKTVGESEHMQLTLLLRNSHPLHFDEVYCQTNSFQKTRVVYGGLVLAWTLALTSRDVGAHMLWDLGLSAGAHPNPTLAGDTLYAMSRVESVKLEQRTADVTLRIVGIKNETARDAWAAHGDALFQPELGKPADQRLAQKVVEITRTLHVPRKET